MFIESLAREVRKEIVWVAGVSSLMCRASAGKSQKLEVTGQLGWNPCRAPSLTCFGRLMPTVAWHLS